MSNNEFYKTTPVSKMIGISTQSVIVWANLYLPSIKKTDSGHNLYSDADIEFLKKVKKLINKGHKHFEIQEMLGSVPVKKEKQEELIKTLPVSNDVQEIAIKKDDIQEVNSADIQAESLSTIDFILNNLDVKATFTNEALREILKKSIAYDENKRLQACK